MRDDILNISFPISPELNQTVTIQPDGYITSAQRSEACMCRG